MMAKSPAVETGQVLLPKEAFWLADFQHEIVHFPKSKYDDQVDSLSQFLCCAKKRAIKPLQAKVTLITQELMVSLKKHVPCSKPYNRGSIVEHFKNNRLPYNTIGYIYVGTVTCDIVSTKFPVKQEYTGKYLENSISIIQGISNP